MTRTHLKHCRVYVDGVDLSGYSRSFGVLGWMADAEQDSALTDGVKNVLIGKPDITAGPLNTFLDNDAAGAFALLKSGTGTRLLTAVIGSNAAPVAGNPVFSWEFEQVSYGMEQGSGFVAVNVPFGGASYASTLTYKRPWGVVLQPKATVTAANTAVGIDDNGASSALGGIFIYHLFSSDGTLTLSVDDAAANSGDGDFDALSGATSGSIDASVSPASGMVPLSTTATVRRYLRPQIALDTATTCVYFSAFIRNNLG